MGKECTWIIMILGVSWFHDCDNVMDRGTS